MEPSDDHTPASAPAAFIHSPALEQYPYPPTCPFNTSRAGRARAILESMGMLTNGDRIEMAPEPADRAAMLTFHTARYLDALEQAPRGRLDVVPFEMGLGTPDCPIFEGMYEYGALACGASLKGADLILAGEVRAAFNPSGGLHHARPALAAGFCYINDVAIACLKLAAAGRRVLFLDVDAHHSDGVQGAFAHRRDVMTISMHESGRTLYPGTGFENDIGAGDGEGYAVNLPMPPAVHDEAFLRAFREVAVPLIGAFDPDVIVFELGMDALAGDPLTHLSLTNNAHADALARVLAFGKPLLATGGGGYHVPNTARGWALVWAVLTGQDDGADEPTAGLGGVMLETTAWHGGLRDRRLAPDARTRAVVDRAVADTIERVKQAVFPHHGL